MNRILITSAAAALVAMSAAPSMAAVVFQDNFDTGPFPHALDSSKYSGLTATTATREFDAVADSTSIFGSGNTGMLKVVDGDGGQVSVKALLPAGGIAAGWASLKLYDVTTNSGSTADWLRLTLTGPSNAFVSFDDGKVTMTGTANIPAYTTTTVASFDVYFNSANVATTINGKSIAANTMAVYVGGSTLVGTSATVNSAVSNINFTTNAGDTSALFYVDNFSVSNVPEPISGSLVSLAGIALLRRRRA